MKKRDDIQREINVLKFVWKMAKGEHGRITIIIIISIISGVIPAGIAYFVKNYIDSNSQSITNVLDDRNLILFLSLIISSIFLKMASSLIMGYAMPNVKRNIEVSCIKKFTTLPYHYISDCIDNRIIMALSIESEMISNLIPMVYNSFIKAPVTVLGFVILLLFISPILTFISILLILTVVIGVLFFRKTIKQLNKTTYNRIGDLHQYFAEWLSGYKIFVASNAITFIEKQLLNVARELNGLSKKITKISSVQSFTIEMITIALTILFVIVAAKSTFTNRIFHVGELIVFPAAILFIRGEILKIIAGYMQLASTESAAKRIMDVIEYPEINTFGSDKLVEQIDCLSFKNVSFSYDGSNKILDNITVTFKRGKIHTIMGRSGAGKTTFINLCLRLRIPQSGSILYNGKGIHSISEEYLMSKIGLVEQEPFIFEGTLAENIFFDKTPNVNYVLKLLKDFELDHLARNEYELLNTRIGQRGRLLSTGEKQRIAIIRVLVRNVDIIFFDEATSNLDTWNTGIIIECIKSIAKDKLVICVSHDMLLIKESSILYELINKKIVCRTK